MFYWESFDSPLNSLLMGDSSLSWVPVVGTAINAWSQERNLEENANQARIQREWQEKMWNKNNAYNTPLAQKQRLEEAGINPYSVMAQGGANTGVSSSPAQSYERAQANFHSPFNEEAVQNSIIQSKQMRSIELDNDAKVINNEFLRAKNIKELLNLDADIGLKIAEKEKNHEDASYLYTQREYLQKAMAYLVQKAEGEAKTAKITGDTLQYSIELEQALKRVEIRLRQSGIAVNSKTIEKLKSDILTNNTIQGYYNSMKELNEQQVENLIDTISSNVRSRQSSRLRDKLEQEKVEAEIAVSILGVVMQANGKKFGALGEFRTVQGQVIKALKKRYPDLVKSGFLDELVYGLEDPSTIVNTPQHGGVR